MPIISCPTCKTQHTYDITSPYRPFCSERCRLIDLGAWSQEQFKIPVYDDDKANVLKGLDSDSII